MKGIFDAYGLCLFGKNFIFELVTRVRTRNYTVRTNGGFLHIRELQVPKSAYSVWTFEPSRQPRGFQKCQAPLWFQLIFITISVYQFHFSGTSGITVPSVVKGPLKSVDTFENFARRQKVPRFGQNY